MAFPERTLNTQELEETKRKSRDRQREKERERGENAIFIALKNSSVRLNINNPGDTTVTTVAVQLLLAGCTPYVHCFLCLSLNFTGGETEAQRGERVPWVTSLLGPLSAQLPHRLDLPLWPSRRRLCCHRRCAHTYPRASFL